MSSITVKNIPDDLYERLRQSAAANHRSINSEIIVCIEQAVHSRKNDVETILTNARKLRERIGKLPITDEELTDAKRAGRP
ncbi:MAG: Arc family DNA-binding protein [Thermoguttaceae bacterium]|jgi:plasmid stability protein